LENEEPRWENGGGVQGIRVRGGESTNYRELSDGGGVQWIEGMDEGSQNDAASQFMLYFVKYSYYSDLL
jgi:hypothetical protein